MSRFRPNIVVSAPSSFAWGEDRWATMRIGERATFYGVKQCDRCKIPAVDQVRAALPLLTLLLLLTDACALLTPRQETGAADGEEPAAALKRIRLQDDGQSVTFALNATHVWPKKCVRMAGARFATRA